MDPLSGAHVHFYHSLLQAREPANARLYLHSLRNAVCTKHRSATGVPSV